MGGTFSKQSLKFELIAVYEQLIKENYPDNLSSAQYNPELINKAALLYDKASEAGIIFGEPFTTAINGLENIGWSFPKPNSEEPWIITKEEAKKILEELKKG